MWINWSKQRHRGLRTWILLVLSKEPKNGAEIMATMETMSQGWWKPSPGSVYPMLESMLDEKLVKKNKEGRYEITAQGREETDWVSRMKGGGPTSLKEILGQMSSNVSYMEDLSKNKSPELKENAKKIAELAARLRALGAK